jgi:hypothetical protein
MKRALAVLPLILVLGAAPAADANHAIGGVGSAYHWASPRQLTVSDGVTVAGEAVPYNINAALADWSTAGGGKFTLTKVATATANIITQRGNYGDNGWLGESQFFTQNGHFSRVVISLNDFYAPYYPEYYTADAKQQTICHELGHSLGLDHNYITNPFGSCLSDANDPLVDGNYPHPNPHDAEELALIYAHDDAATQSGGKKGKNGGGGGKKGGGGKGKEAPEGPFLLDVLPIRKKGPDHK